MAFEFRLPDIGEGVHEGEIVRWLVQPGDAITEDQPIVEIATDKVTAEIPSPVHGVLKERRGEPGETIQVGSVLAIIAEEETGSNASAEPTALSPAQTPPPPSPLPAKTGLSQHASASSTGRPAAKVLAAPATRRLARELGVELSTLSGSGPGGRVTTNDIYAAQTKPKTAATAQIASVSAPTSQNGSTPAFTEGGERREPFTPLRRKIAERLVKSQQTTAHVAYVEEVDVSRLVELRNNLQPDAEAEGVKLTYLPFIIKAVTAGLRKYPVFNAQLDEERRELVYRDNCHIGLAVSADQGLVVPIIRHAEQKNLLTLAREIESLAGKARSGKLAVEEMQGGTFTISSIGSIGGLFGIPIINYPEVAILGVNKIEKRPVVHTVDGEDRIVIREMMNLSISGDHRVVDGAEIALFIKEVAACLENPGRLLLA